MHEKLIFRKLLLYWLNSMTNFEKFGSMKISCVKFWLPCNWQTSSKETWIVDVCIKVNWTCSWWKVQLNKGTLKKKSTLHQITSWTCKCSILKIVRRGWVCKVNGRSDLILLGKNISVRHMMHETKLQRSKNLYIFVGDVSMFKCVSVL